MLWFSLQDTKNEEDGNLQHHLHPMVSVKTPPKTGPMADAMAQTMEESP
jgi:hypothetical protein